MLNGNGDSTILDVQGLKVHFPITAGIWRKTIGYVRAVDDVSFHLNTGETLGLVGESGCGKTTTGRAIMRAVEPTGGNVIFQMGDGSRVDTATAGADALRILRQQSNA